MKLSMHLPYLDMGKPEVLYSSCTAQTVIISADVVKNLLVTIYGRSYISADSAHRQPDSYKRAASQSSIASLS
ncbi:hypothetical protein F0562_034651 [Nyssa sinensis]|uniref:Uncharacterized protein n=1 Tax=Nyssa sinensis TaxID=561372 RepID=A0A5J5ABI6_9ASTE|nr:hypothetical protein F0562_034651 [Nyssa sinensis]